MRTVVRRIVFLAMVMVLAGGVGRAFAQNTLVAQVPFAFRADNAVHPAGRYEFIVMDDERAIEFENSGRRGEFMGVTHMTSPASGPVDGRLVFDKAEGTYTLAEVWAPRLGGFLIHAAKYGNERQAIPLRATAGQAPR